MLPYEDVTLTTPDGLKIKGYVIPARKTFVPSMEVNSMGMADRKKRGLEETEKWAEEIGTQEAIDVSHLGVSPGPSVSCRNFRAEWSVRQIKTYGGDLPCERWQYGTPDTNR